MFDIPWIFSKAADVQLQRSRATMLCGAQEVQRCTVKLSHDLFQRCHELWRCPYPFHRSNAADCSRLTGSPGKAVFLAASFCCFIARRTTKTNTFCVLLLLEAQASEVFPCSLKQCLLIAQVLKLMRFVRDKSVFL